MHKYRPYFSTSELTYVIDSLKITYTGTNKEVHALIRYLESFQLKINAGIQAPNLQLSPAPTMQTKLGLDSPSLSPTSNSPTSNSSGNKTLVEQRLEAYNKWKENPAKCAVQEIARAHMYRYENDLMSPTEEEKYAANH